ncbi:mCG147148 [Mus musculus]|nr:mCG147148 [Mus musculus]
MITFKIPPFPLSSILFHFAFLVVLVSGQEQSDQQWFSANVFSCTKIHEGQVYYCWFPKYRNLPN